MMSSNLTLYRKDGVCSFIPHALLNELNIPYEEVLLKVDTGVMEAVDGSFTNEEYKKVHPSGYVPALKVDGEIITELPAIVQYITELAPESQLLGRTPLERAKVNSYMAWLNGTLHEKGYAGLWRSGRFTDSKDENIHQSTKDKAWSTLMNSYDKIEQQLNGPHAVGDRFTVVDVTMYNYYRWGALRIGIEKGDFAKKYPKYARLARGVENMESVKKTMSEEILPSVF